MRQAAHVYKESHVAAHDSVSFIGIIALPTVVGNRNPIQVLSDNRDELWVETVVREVSAMALYAVASFFEGVRNVVPQIAVGKEGKPMLRIRKLELPLAHPDAARSRQ